MKCNCGKTVEQEYLGICLECYKHCAYLVSHSPYHIQTQEDISIQNKWLDKIKSNDFTKIIE